MEDIQKALREHPDFNPLGDDNSEFPEWQHVCEETLRTLDDVDVDSKPPTERELFRYQYEYYSKYGDREATEKMFHTIASYSGSLILKVKKSSRYISKDKLRDMAREVSLRVVSQYLKRPGFIIKGSFAGFIKWKILEVTGEADDFERADQIDPVTKRKKKMPLLSLNSLVDKARGQETSIEDLQESLHFVNIGAPVEAGVLTTEMRMSESVSGIMNIVSTAMRFIDDRAISDESAYLDKLYATTALHTLFSGGIENYQKYQKYAPNTKVLTIVEETSKEIMDLLRSSMQREEEEY
ncbi:MAG: hypothetical protein LC687_04110 [Actinobacteria bacterium]|nr:hypothetical protein [Actinomycetota bacterium]MCA1807019.1 hypothetical protein [Actinomycetota bacterium]